jgi:aminoglycoside/choline kinase family phosphotransferase
MPESVTWADASRRADFHRWLAQIAPRHGLQPDSLAPASADASFRRYFRLDGTGASHIVMDAPPPQEDVRPFVRIAGLIERAGLNGPRVLEADVERGFLLLGDLGRRLYLDALRDGSATDADRLMRDAITALVRWQLHVDASELPPYDEALLARELALFPEWCVQREFGRTWTDAEHATWQQVCRLLIDSALAQPTVAVHRDWMPRNLMVADPNPGILDFQDAVRGPVSYDVASLLRDAFISWDEEREIDWAARYWDHARRAGVALGDTLGNAFGEFWRALEWMGLQRHLTVLGIFCRLKHRDGKPHYASDLPRFFGYATRVAHRYAPLRPLIGLLEPLSGPLVTQGFTF